jgi:hypothetical protein
MAGHNGVPLVERKNTRLPMNSTSFDEISELSFYVIESPKLVWIDN